MALKNVLELDMAFKNTVVLFMTFKNTPDFVHDIQKHFGHCLYHSEAL